MVVTHNTFEKNFTPKIVNAISELKSGDELTFEKGIYHFYEEGSYEGFFASVGHLNGVKKVVFPIIGLDNITIDGNGSTFVFHGMLSPFVIQNSRNITVKNISVTTFLAPYALMHILEKRDDGFVCHFDSEKMPYEVEDGNVVFITESEKISLGDRKLSLHALDRLEIRYLFSPDCPDSRENLPARYMNCKALEKDGNVEFIYVDDGNPKAEKCVYRVGENVCINLEESRPRVVFSLDGSDDTVISDVRIIRCGGMGIIAQVCHNVEISGLCVKPDINEPVTTTADILHIVNCSGKVSIHDCDFESSLDDACNVHGTYTAVCGFGDGFVDVEYKHHGYSFFELYKPEDILTVIDSKTLDIIGTFVVKSCRFIDDSGMKMRIELQSPLPEGTKCTDLVESSLRMPDVHIYNNKSKNIPNWRLSGAGNILVENNFYDGCTCPIYAFDLIQFWYESGRIKNITVKNNIFRNAELDAGFIITGVSGFSGEATPKIHDSITITDNAFEGFSKLPYEIFGFKNVDIRNNKLI